MRALLFAGVALAACGGTAHAQREGLSGQQLASVCRAGDPKSGEACEAYVEGVSDMMAFYQSLMPPDGSKGGRLPSYVCVPGPTTGPQLRQVFVDWAARNPGGLQDKAVVSVALALKDKYHCSSQR